MARSEGASLSDFLRESLTKCLEYGHWGFHDLAGKDAGHSDQRISVEAMYALHEGWAELAAGDLLLEPSGGIVVVSWPQGVDWAMPLKAALERRGAELPVCGLTHSGEVLYGDDLGAFSRSSRVTVVNDITTVGTDLRRMHLRLLGCGISVGRLHAMVHRGPTFRGTFDSLPYGASINFPLPLVAPSACFECLLARALWPLLS
jgi:hypothetical protein